MVTSRLADHIASAMSRPLPAEVINKASLHVLDTLAAMVSGTQLEAGKKVLPFVAGVGGREEALVVGSRTVTTATLAALAGSQPTPAASITALASRISSSVTDATAPFVSRIARIARSQLAGSPIRMAVAIVSGFTVGCVAKSSANAVANGAAPAACTASKRGTRSISPSACASRNAFPNADVLPRFPAGNAIQSGACQPRC